MQLGMAVERLAERFPPGYLPSSLEADECLDDGEFSRFLTEAALSRYRDLVHTELTQLEPHEVQEAERLAGREQHPSAKQIERLIGSPDRLMPEMRETIAHHLGGTGSCLRCWEWAEFVRDYIRTPTFKEVEHQETFLFCKGPLLSEQICWQELRDIHYLAFPRGHAPPEEVLRSMLLKDLVFACFVCLPGGQRKLAAVVHARLCEAGSNIAANAILNGQDDNTAPWPVFRLEHPSVVCHAAVTHPDWMGLGLCQMLVTRVVLRYLAAHPDTRDRDWLTSSPPPSRT